MARAEARSVRRFSISGPRMMAAVATVVVLMGAAAALGAPGHARGPATVSSVVPLSSPGVVRVCTEHALKLAIGASSTVTYGANCAAVLFNLPITIPSNQTVSISSGGFSVTLTGASTSRLFIVQGGHLNISGLSLTNG